jgi:hypothetical protein
MMSLPGRHTDRVWRRKVMLPVLPALLVAMLLARLAQPAVCGAAEGTASTAGNVILRAVVDRHTPKTLVPRHAVGLSIEYADVLNALGSPATTGQANAPLARLFQNITDAGNGAPMLRLGGGTADESWWNPNGKPRPDGINYDLDANFVAALHDFRSVAHLPFIMALNFAADRPRIAVDWARAAIKGLGRHAVRAFEIGNEPDLYTTRRLGNHYARPQGWGFGDFLNDFGTFSRRLKGLRRWLPLAGPASCCAKAWDQGLARFLRRFHRRVSLVTFHHYPVCNHDHPDSLRFLLGKRIFQDAAARIGALAAKARTQRRAFRVTESGPNACRPDPRYAVALWATDWLFALSALHRAPVDFHQMGTSPFSTGFVNSVLDPHFEASVSPLYYAMLLFARAVPNGARLLPYTTFAQRVASGANATVWATIDRAGTVRVVVNNKRNQAGYAAINVIGARRRASLQRLRGQNLSSGNGVTLAGQAIANPSRTGRLEGQKVIQHVARRHGVYRFRMPAASVALATIRHVG